MTRPTTLRARQWQVAPPVPAQYQQKFSHIPPILLQILYNRGITQAGAIQSFLERRYLLEDDPFQLPDMDKAVMRIRQAIDDDETVVVYGDFDADGVTSTVLLTQALRGLGMRRSQARPYIPDRVDEGYGLNNDALTTIREEFDAALVITVDCGIRSIAEVEHANAIGLDVIVTDHHSIGRKLPPALAVINPKRPESTYPEEMLAGVGIAYKLVQALVIALPEYVAFDPTDLLDLVAIGTVADLAPLLGENRKLVVAGLDILREGRRPGVAALAQVARTEPAQISAETIGFGLGPRINAAGRLAKAYTAARLLAAPDLRSATNYAQELDQLNRQRQQLTEKLSEHAETLIDPDDFILIASDTTFEPGVVGLVASRLSDKYYRPSIVIEQGESESRGSCRSIPEFHITDALDEVADLLIRHGGHAQAAGFTIDNANLDAFADRMRSLASDALAGKELLPTLTIDAELRLGDVDWALYETLQQLEPTGYANPTPVFVSHNVQVINHRTVGQNGDHLQLEVADSYKGFKCIAFRQGAWAEAMPRLLDIVYTIGVNEWRGRRTLQLMVQDMRSAEAPARLNSELLSNDEVRL
ncbi:MAG: single-stranded-DNA-specific exonuclease RecJ [Anaerolineae bacterium]|nr:single-stranded-DNA-specific exonuclease RecJ [Anaerolineae bacterium]